MANVLKRDKQVAVISMLLEGSSVRSAERITGIHRDTILRLMVRVAVMVMSVGHLMMSRAFLVGGFHR